MPTEKQQQQHTEVHTDALVHRHADREHSLAWMNSMASEFSGLYTQRTQAIRNGDRNQVLTAEQALDAARRGLLEAVSAELQRVARVNELHATASDVEDSGEPEASEEAPTGEDTPRAKTAAERQRQYRARKRGATA